MLLVTLAGDSMKAQFLKPSLFAPACSEGRLPGVASFLRACSWKLRASPAASSY